MAGIKIINILKDDTFPDILELFRRTEATEVIFVLPKNGRVFRTEDHFAAFASEGATGGKTLSILCNNDQTSSWARKYKFNVMSSAKPSAASKKKAVAVLATQPPPMDPDIQDENNDAFSDLSTSDETMGNKPADDVQDEVNPLHGMHIEEEDGPVNVDRDLDGVADEPTDAELAVAPVQEVKVSAARADLDYIDEMWRQKAGQSSVPAVQAKPTKTLGARFLTGGKPSKTVAASILALSVGVLGAVVYLATGSAHVVITPTARALDTQLIVQTSDVFSSVDSNFNKIPGQLFNVSKTADHTADATGQRDVASKARGKLTITNEFSSTSQTLVSTTRFVSPEGLVFRTLQTVTVPGSTVKNGTPVPGTVTVDVIADKPGEQYNLVPGKFGVAAFKEKGDTDRYAKVYGTSTVAFAGGANGPSKVITQADYDSAKDGAVADATKEIKDAFSEQAVDMTIVPDITPAIAKVQSTAQADDAAKEVTVSVTATLDTVAFRKADLYELIRQALLKKERVAVLPEKLDLSYTDVLFKSDTGVLVFTINIKGTGYTPVDPQAIIGDIKGMSGARIHDYFAAKEGVASATVSLSPFWVRSVPDSAERIHPEVNYDGQ